MSNVTAIKEDEQEQRPSDPSTDHQTEVSTEHDATGNENKTSSAPAQQSDDTTEGAPEDNPTRRNSEVEEIVMRIKKRRDFGETAPARDRHHGLYWRDLTVKGIGKENSIQWTNTDVLLGLPKLIWNGLTFRRWRRKRIEKRAVWNILSDFTGFVKPGEMLLVLGRPGAGCSTFLKILGNQRLGYESVEGTVNYGGTDSKVMGKHFHSEIMYSPEEDFHEALLTVRQTLSFALRTRTRNSDAKNHGESPSNYRNSYLMDIAKLFWIENALDTKVGNNLIRGVSGGEKRRVSIAEALIAGASIQCWDNSTRGLDASTALQYIESLRCVTDMFDASNIVMLYQASENLYQKFDKVLLIEGGKCAYFGPAREAKAYFEGLGFECPPRWTTADFLTSVSDVNARKVREERRGHIPETPDEFHDAYLESSIRERVMRELAEFEHEMEVAAATRRENDRDTKRKTYALPFIEQILVLSKRQLLILLQSRSHLAGKYGVVIWLAFIVGSLFYNLPDNTDGLFTRGGVLYYIVLFNTLLAMAELSASFEARPVIQKHKNFSFYQPSAYALAQVVSDVPLVFIQVAIFNIIVYFLSHLARDAGKFWLNYMHTFCITMTVYAYFRAVGSLSASLDVATRITGLSMQAFITYTGYLIHPSSMKPWLKWLIWINPVQYSFEAILSNELHHSLFPCAPQSIFPQGPAAAKNHQGCTVTGSRPNSLVVNGDMYAKANFTYERRHLWRNFGIVIAFYVLFVVMSLLGFEMQRPSFGGKSVTVYKHGEAPAQEKSEKSHAQNDEDEEKTLTNQVVFPSSNVNEGRTDSHWHNLNEETEDKENDEDNNSHNSKMETFTWRNVNYSVPTKSGAKPLLQNIQGYVRPGRLTALIGSSGSGKTTLLNALSQRLSYGTLSGEFLIDGKPLPKSFARDTGFAAQADVHEASLTVRESLRFSAILRQPRDVPVKEKYAYCEEVLDMLELKTIAGAIIGHEGSGLNQEQRKRVTIAVELASKPKMLFFLDEPTSGLDSLGAFNIVRLLRKLTDSGQSVLCTIHQPSAVLFEHFDELLLLKSGGKLVYHGELGPNFSTLINYFERNGGNKIGPSANPAEWMLEVIGAGNPTYKGQDWAEVWNNSPEHRQRAEEIEEIIQTKRNEVSAFQGTYENDTYAMPIWFQIPVVTKRAFVSYWRSPNYALGKFILQIACGLFNTFTFWELSHRVIHMQYRVFSVFMMLVIGPPLIQQLQPQYIHFRKLYEARESQSRIYSWVAVAASCTAVEIPYAMVSGTLYFCCWYFGTWFPWNSFAVGICWMYMMLYACYYTGLGQFIAALSPNEIVASMLVPAFFTFVISFCGVVVPHRNIPTFWRRWMYWFTPLHYLVEGYVGIVTNGVTIRCHPEEYTYFTPPPGMSCQDYAGDTANKAGGYLGPDVNGMCSYCPYSVGNQWALTLNIKYKHKWRNFVIVISYVIFNFLLVYLLTWIYLYGVPGLRRRLHQFELKMTSWLKQKHRARGDVENQ